MTFTLVGSDDKVGGDGQATSSAPTAIARMSMAADPLLAQGAPLTGGKVLADPARLLRRRVRRQRPDGLLRGFDLPRRGRRPSLRSRARTSIRQIAAADAQTARRWKVDVTLAGVAARRSSRDAQGQPLAGLDVAGALRRARRQARATAASRCARPAPASMSASRRRARASGTSSSKADARRRNAVPVDTTGSAAVKLTRDCAASATSRDRFRGAGRSPAPPASA